MLALLTAAMPTALAAAAPAGAAAAPAELLRRHAPLLVLDRREPGPRSQSTRS